MAETDVQDPELIGLRKQLRLLAIITAGLFVVVVGLIIGTIRRAPAPDSGWPNISAGVLQAKRIVLMTDDGKPTAMLSTVGSSASLVFLDPKGEIRVLVGLNNDRGHITLSGANQTSDTYITNGGFLIGNEKLGGIEMKGPPFGGPAVRIFDTSGYSATLGRSSVVNHVDGTVSTTSAAALMGSSKERASTWSLLSQPVFTPAVAGSKSEAGKSASLHRK